MKENGKKLLKISGIVFLVTILLFFAIYGIVSALNKKKIYVEAISEGFIQEVESKVDIFNDNSKEALYHLYEKNFLVSIKDNVNLQYEYYLPYFANVGLNSKDRKIVDKQKEAINNNAIALKQTYDNLNTLYEKDSLTTEEEAYAKTLFYSNYLQSYKNLMTEKLKLVSHLSSILEKNKIELPMYISNVTTTSNVALNVGLKISFDYLSTKKVTNSLVSSTTYILTIINNRFEDFSDSSYFVTVANDYEKKLIDHKNANAELIKEYNKFEDSFKRLNDVELTELKSNTFYEENGTSTENLKVVYNFLAETKTYSMACEDNATNAIMLGIKMN